MPLIPLANCFVQSTSFPHASIRVIRSIRAIRDTSCRSSCCRFPSRSLRLCERQKPFSPPFSLCSLKTRSQLSASNVPSSAFTVPRLVSPSLRETLCSVPFLQLPTRNSEEPLCAIARRVRSDRRSSRFASPPRDPVSNTCICVRRISMFVTRKIHWYAQFFQTSSPLRLRSKAKAKWDRHGRYAGIRP